MSKLRVLDCTLRDGGLVNNFNFHEEYIKAHIAMISETKVDYIELGYKCNTKKIAKDKFGKLKFCDDEYIKSIIEDINNTPKLAFMVDVNKFDENTIKDCIYSPFIMARVACYLKEYKEAIKILKFLNFKGYETTINIMAISTEKISDIITVLKEIKKEAYFAKVYIVDSFGGLYPNQIIDLIENYKHALGNMDIGIHTHNNLQLAFSNTITAIDNGVSMVDGSVNGMGRGAGNCPIELLIGYLRNFGYELKPIIKFIEKYFLYIKKNDQWGLPTRQLLSGLFNQHPIKGIVNIEKDINQVFDVLAKTNVI